MELHECILTRNDCCRRGTPLVPRGVMVHSTGANNPYLRRYVQPDDGELGKNRYDNDWNRPGLPVCVHAFLGKKAGGGIAVYQTLPWEVQAWHCGRSGNRTHLAFEICEDGLDDRAYFTAVYREAVELTAYLCRRFGLDPLADGVVLDHAEGNRRGIASAHGDVAHWFPRFGKTMDDFRRETAALLRRPAEKEAEDLTLQELDARIDARIRTVLEGTGSKASSWAQEELARIDYRMDWENAFRAHLQKLDAQKPVVFCGDLNVAHQEIDLKNPKPNRGKAGFSDEERGKFSELLAAGFTDTFRYLYPDLTGAYSWWSYRFHAREKNAGWRIDYFCVSNRIANRIKEAKIHTEIYGSDDCPVELCLDL